jgi:hypothetical protein
MIMWNGMSEIEWWRPFVGKRCIIIYDTGTNDA